MKATAPDLSRNYPRSGRTMLGRYAFLARAADKIRAQHAGTLGDYVGYCPFTLGFLEHSGVSQDSFDALIKEGATDDDLVAYFDTHVSETQRQAANHWVLETQKDSLDEQDADEGRT